MTNNFAQDVQNPLSVNPGILANANVLAFEFPTTSGCYYFANMKIVFAKVVWRKSYWILKMAKA